MSLFDADFLRRLEYLSLVSRRAFRGQLLGQRRSSRRGAGLEFAEHREYTAGDDLRYLDWNVFARHDELLLKRFQEEEDLHVHVLLDCSQSMDVGQPSKFDAARRIAAALAYIALANLDRVGVVAFTSHVVDVFPLARGKERIVPLMHFLSRLECRAEETDLARAIQSFLHQSQRTGLVLLVSDLFDPAGFQRGLDLLRYQGCETHLIQLYDRSEADPGWRGDMELLDVETGRSRQVTLTQRSLREYRQVFERFLESVEMYCLRHALGCTRTTSDVPCEQLILKMMRSGGTLR